MPAMRLRLLTLLAVSLQAACSGQSAPATPGPDTGTQDGGAEATPDAPSCTPVAASSEPVTVQNEYGSLGGVLEIPEGCSPMPVVLILSGSGTSDRDGNTPGDPNRTDLYKLLGEALRDQAHVATLRYDDHGLGASASALPADVTDFRFETEVKDAGRFVDLMRSDSRFSKVVVAGHSQGSLTGILAAKSSPIDGLISLAGAGRPAGELLHDQLASKLTPALLAELDAAIAKLEAGELAGPLTPPLDQILPEYVQPYVISWFKYDPEQEIGTLQAPTLLVQGKTDTQVSVEDAELLQQGKPDATLALIDDMCHPLKQANLDPNEQKAAYTDPTVPLAAGLMPPLVEFMAGLFPP
jgi:uncharacterized protein